MHGSDADRPRDKLGIISSGPLPRWEWETIPDQNGRRWADDGKEHDEPPNPGSDPLTSAAHDGAPITGLSGRVAGSRALLVCVRCEVVDTGESTARVVPGFDPFEDRL